MNCFPHRVVRHVKSSMLIGDATPMLVTFSYHDAIDRAFANIERSRLILESPIDIDEENHLIKTKSERRRSIIEDLLLASIDDHYIKSVRTART